MANTTPAFTESYKRLNEAQKKAVDTLDGPVMVVAGPGTGKTQILTLRIANILQKTDAPPDAVLALTFTEAGVDAMKRRLLSLIGPTAYKVRIHTFHGFCNEVIHAHPEHFPRIISSTALTDIESVVLIREAIGALELDKLRPFGDPFYYVPAIKGAISTLKREHKRPEDVLAHTKKRIADIEQDPESIHQKGAHKGKMKGDVGKELERLRKEAELGQVFAWYEGELQARRRFDFEDMIGEVVKTLEENEDFRLQVQEQFLYILADEHQDANGAQNKLLELLASYDASPNLFIVGDEKQAIFRFQGASLESFAQFQKAFPDAVLIPLTDSYRSGAPILDAAHSLMKDAIPDERHPKLASRVDAPEQATVELREFTTEEYELAWVVSAIAERIAEGVSPGDIAVIFRNNADAKPLARLLSQQGILHVLDSHADVFDMHAVAQLVTYLRLATHLGNDEYFAHALHFPFSGVSAHDAYKIFVHAQKKRMPYIEVVNSEIELAAAKVHDSAAVQQFGVTLLSLAKAAQEESARDFFDRVIHESGYLSYVLARPDAVAILGAVRGLARELETLSGGKTLYTGADFVGDLGLYEEYGIEIEPDIQPKERQGAVHLVTAHRSKGLEYEYVYIIHARDGKWGNRISRDKVSLSTLGVASSGSDIEDERRLFYVALTRAKRFVSVSYGLTSSTRTRESGITQFMLEMEPERYTTQDTEEFEASVAPQDVFLPKVVAPEEMSDREFLRDAFLEQGISATALNNYLVCPWKYFYRNLVRVPEKPTPSSLYGNAVHNALRLFRDLAASTQEYPSLETLLGYLSDSIEAQGFGPTSYDDAKQKGMRALTDWHERHREDFVFEAQCEKKFEVYQPIEGDLDRVLLRGLIDVIEFAPNGVHVIDYKTGKHKSRNELEGNTKNATGDYKRQLDFYCILLELAGMEKPQELQLEFVEPDEKGKTVTHSFAYDEVSVGELRETIGRVTNEIYSLSFWDSRCDDAQCEFCKLRDTISG